MAKDLIYTGIYCSTSKGYGFASIEGFEKDLFIPGELSKNAWNGDTVEVKLHPNDRFTRRGNKLTGEVVRIAKRNIVKLVGTVRISSGGFIFVIPDRLRIPSDLMINTDDSLAAEDGMKVVCEITDYGNGIRNSFGKIIEIIGKQGDNAADILSIVRSFELPEQFPEEVLSYADKRAIIPIELKGRTDLRKLQMVTIDGEDAKDLDDAVSLSYDGEFFHLGVHIADVSEYVSEGSVLDEDALNRGTSVYLADRVIPMLPQSLSNGACSLNPNQDRYALSVLMKIDGQGNVVDSEIMESVICTTQRMTYTVVADMLENPDADYPQFAELLPMFQEMQCLSAILRNKRRKRGAISFDSKECKFCLDEKGNVLDIAPYNHNVATDLIEDFMLAANETVAEYFFHLDTPFVYRVHPVPDEEKIGQLLSVLLGFGITLKSVGRKGGKVNPEEIHPKEIQKMLSGIAGLPEEDLITRLALRSMKQARYSTDCSGHFGLSCTYYCHFTSPIRRYPDLQIHRIIKESLHARLTSERVEHYNSILESVAAHSSAMERRAVSAERAVDQLEKTKFISAHIGEEFEGIVSGITKWGIYVELPNMVEGMIRIQDLPGDRFVYDSENSVIYGSLTGIEFTLGVKLRIVVSSTDLTMRTIDFLPAWDNSDIKTFRMNEKAALSTRSVKHKGPRKRR